MHADQNARKSVQSKLFVPGAVHDGHLLAPIDHSASQASQLQQLQRLAEEVRSSFEQLLASIAGKLSLSQWSCSLKDTAAMIEKLNRADKAKDGLPLKPGQLHDVLRGCVVLEGFEQLALVPDILAQTQFKIAKADTRRLLEPSESGWRCAYLILRAPNGLYVEVQFLTEELQRANEEVHRHYEKFRGASQLFQAELQAHAAAFSKAWSRYMVRAGLTEETLSRLLQQFWLRIENSRALVCTGTTS